RHSSIMDLKAPFSREERKLVWAQIQHVYDLFLQRVSESRGMQMPLRPLGPRSYSCWHPAWLVHHGQSSTTHVAGSIPGTDPRTDRHARRVLPTGALRRAAGGL